MPDKAAAKWSLQFVRFSGLWLFITLSATLLLGYIATSLQFDFSPDNIYLENDAERQFFVEHFLPAFGKKANAVIVAIDGDITDKKVERALFDLHHALLNTPGVSDIQSLV